MADFEFNTCKDGIDVGLHFGQFAPVGYRVQDKNAFAALYSKAIADLMVYESLRGTSHATGKDKTTVWIVSVTVVECGVLLEGG